ncbi:hypothetical protein P152DRAFT_484008 [Eremomyces bilateralis CBS 781.70]|uniref:Uncharacterized protein n=1 Tax=Eremomyces bilateralis CBS 781.70 TaxID=1392243 RepID=A0A6G1FX01_9PEZI|nr:uncharacterized protein P152DRAFT_484008 [Eremomyces bilateralis CBS 781.70]KAF1810196.1 hypothetical protein P152DRAFT_484008 [Eremomyces bilateralis CBS 781.70]
MLASPIWSSYSYMPAKPSPLSPRSSNVPPHSPFSMSASAKPAPQPYSKRAIKPVPVLKSAEALNKKRREIFFRDVARKRDDKRWAERCEYIMRSDFVHEKRRSDSTKSRAAEYLEDGIDDDDVEFALHSSPVQHETLYGQPQASHSQEELDFIEQMEDAEMQSLIGMMEDDAPKNDISQAQRHQFADIDIDLDDDDWRDMAGDGFSSDPRAQGEHHDAMDTS